MGGNRVGGVGDTPNLPPHTPRAASGAGPRPRFLFRLRFSGAGVVFSGCRPRTMRGWASAARLGLPPAPRSRLPPPRCTPRHPATGSPPRGEPPRYYSAVTKAAVVASPAPVPVQHPPSPRQPRCPMTSRGISSATSAEVTCGAWPMVVGDRIGPHFGGSRLGRQCRRGLTPTAACGIPMVTPGCPPLLQVLIGSQSKQQTPNGPQSPRNLLLNTQGMLWPIPHIPSAVSCLHCWGQGGNPSVPGPPV